MFKITEFVKGLAFLGMASLLVSCGSSVSDSPYPYADVKVGLEHPGQLKLDEEIAKATYVPLEVTGDDASLIDGVANYAVTSRYIYVLPVKEARVALFDRKGHFLKTLIPFGSGPGEISGYVSNIQVDEKNDRLYLFTPDRMMSYTLEGEYMETTVYEKQAICQWMLDGKHRAAVSMPYVPFAGGSFGIGIFTGKGEPVVSKNDFSSPLVPYEKTGLTTHIGVGYGNASLLFKAGSNDTVFRMAGNLVQPACILHMGVSDDEIRRSLDVTDFKSLRDFGDGSDYFVSDMFETEQRFYFRLRNNERHYAVSVDKKSGELLAEKCEQPAPLTELAAATLLHGMLGTKAYRNFPVWGNVVGNELVQVVTSGELDFYRDMKSISIPDELQSMGEESNPVFIFYELR